jgi:serine/threonine protein kinase
MTILSHQHALLAGTVLMEYRLAGLLGAGAFGITYLARDTHLDKDVAIKEYLPSAFAARAADGTVVPVTQQQERDYRWGLERFSQEARTLGRFSHPNIVRVNRYFELNGTGYMVMDYERGQSLKAFVQAHPFPSEPQLRALIGPLLDGLEKVHAAGFLHRDIKPDNIFLRDDGHPVLIDFGSARQTLGEPAQALTTIVSPGYAPFEQYTTSKQQGPWSDIYSLGGVLYFLVTGENPPDAITRMKGDTLSEQLAPARQHYSVGLIEAIEWSLALEDTERPREVAIWRNALVGAVPAAMQPVPSSTRSGRVEPHVPTTVLRSDLLDGSAAPSILLASPVRLHEQLPQAWNIMLKHALLVVVIAALGALLGRLPAFQEAQILEGRINCSMLAQLLSAVGAIGFVWLLGRGVASRFRAGNGPHAVLYDLSMPLVTLGVVTIAYLVLQRPIAPLLDDALSSIYTWCFVLGTCACAVWLSMAVFSHAEALRKLLHDYRRTGVSTVD